MNWSSIGTIILGGGGLVTGILALFSARANKGKIHSETEVNIANAEHTRESIHHSREMFLYDEMEKVHKKLRDDIEFLREEVGVLRRLIESHVPWDWEVIRQLKLAGIDFRDPPSLNYIKDTRKRKDEQ